LSTFVGIFLADRVGRKPLLLSGLAVMIVSLTILGFVFQFTTGNLLLGLATVFICLYISGFEASIGCLFWPLLTEAFRPEYKDAGASLINVLQWLFNIMLAVSFPSLVAWLSQAIVFWGFAVVGIFCWVYMFFKMQETRVRSGSVQDTEETPNYQFSGPARSADERIFSDGESEEPLF
jgi:MFS transporter, SP family, galactose:H+ symporter